nr:LOW QUALITY PROTEIN: mannose-P-dolichol utilization defect 1 protein-like [Rhipicephalus microplus]
MGTLVKQVLQAFFPGKCYDEIIVRHNFENVGCLKLALSKCLGYGIIVGSTLVKVPQIVKIVQTQSSEGISVTSVLMELMGMTATAAYSYAQRYPFSSWGRGPVPDAGDCADRGAGDALPGPDEPRGGLHGLLHLPAGHADDEGVPVPVLWSAQLVSLPVIICGKLMQVWSNYRQGHTGQLSLITSALLFLGGVARIFTSLTETGDPLIVVTFCLATIANSLIFGQVLYYWDATNKQVQKKKTK